MIVYIVLIEKSICYFHKSVCNMTRSLWVKKFYTIKKSIKYFICKIIKFPHFSDVLYNEIQNYSMKYLFI